VRHLAVLCALFFALAGTANAAPPTVYIVDKASAVTPAEVQSWLPALQTQISGEFEQTWNLDATVSVSDAPPVGAWTITLTDQGDQAGALGYHDVCHKDGHGVPCGFVYAQTTLDAGDAVSVTLDHELLEMLADPYTTSFEKVGKRFYIREVCDAPESDAYAYSEPGSNVLLSDFVTPFFFRPGHVGPYDYRGAVSRPLEILPGGYLSYWQGGSWWQDWNRARVHLGV
jgi:hypothetical protein